MQKPKSARIVESIKREAQRMPDDFWKGAALRLFLLAFTPFAFALKKVMVDWLMDESKKRLVRTI